MFKAKNVCMIISVIIAVIWVFVGISAVSGVSADLNSEDTATAVGTGIGMTLMMPYLIISTIGALLHTVGGFTYIRGLALAGLIVECVGLLLGITWGFGYIPAIIFGFIGYTKMKKKN